MDRSEGWSETVRLLGHVLDGVRVEPALLLEGGERLKECRQLKELAHLLPCSWLKGEREAFICKHIKFKNLVSIKITTRLL